MNIWDVSSRIWSSKRCLKYNSFYRETHPPRKPELIQKASFHVEDLPYDSDKDEFTCPAKHPMTYRETCPYRTENGSLTERRFYECSKCGICPLKLAAL